MIVYVLEVVEIEYRHRKRRFLEAGARQHAFNFEELTLQSGSIVEAGERIGESLAQQILDLPAEHSFTTFCLTSLFFELQDVGGSITAFLLPSPSLIPKLSTELEDDQDTGGKQS
ncbi:MAG: hypothetical protein WDN67_04630 [Candidatus Moraniibacteriota bacterium]